MEVIAIESKTFELIKDRFEGFAKQIKQLCNHDQPNNKWLDNQDVCNLLNISKRTLQYYRNTGKISFSQVNSKCYYKVADVEKLLRDSLISTSKQNQNNGNIG
ncbi:MAG: helix-turn-helix domain-containing protein [Breznakibacter sp.]